MTTTELLKHLLDKLPPDIPVYHVESNKENSVVPLVFDGTEKNLYLENPEVYFVENSTGKILPEQLVLQNVLLKEKEEYLKKFTKIVVI